MKLLEKDARDFCTLAWNGFLHKLRDLEADLREYWTESYFLNLFFFILQEMNLFAPFRWCHIVWIFFLFLE